MNYTIPGLSPLPAVILLLHFCLHSVLLVNPATSKSAAGHLSGKHSPWPQVTSG